jgi:hypothetical protein
MVKYSQTLFYKGGDYMKKKLQIFISSTYLDLKEERQAAVEAILDAGHIPAGMELFKAGNESQLKTIKRWIDESDVYLLILGGRYGSVEPESCKSYTHLEYEYAIEKEKAIFSVVLTQPLLYKKAAESGADYVFEKNEITRYEEFKTLVQSKIIRPADDLKDIKLAIHTTLNEFLELYKFSGWVKGNEFEDNTKLKNENIDLIKENQKLRVLLDKQSTTKKIGDFEFEDLKNALASKDLIIPKGKIENPSEIKIDYLSVFNILYDILTTGVSNSIGDKDETTFIYYNITPYLISFGLLEKVKVTGAKYERVQMSKNGQKFKAMLELEKIKQKS